jgi:hypothetical protein
MRVRSNGRIAIAAVLAAVVCLGSLWLRERSSSARLVSIEQLPLSGETCLPEETNAFAIAGSPPRNLFAALQARTVYAAQGSSGAASVDVTRAALRTIQDTDSIYTAVAVDTQSNEVFLQ